uniref:Transmembrane protein 59 n=1 Tax=Ornithorhynchus anatinus TaxID=9258 RepID=A0A6I8N2B0_ORNAN
PPPPSGGGAVCVSEGLPPLLHLPGTLTGEVLLTACAEAYPPADEQFACHLGCQNQLPSAELRKEQVRPRGEAGAGPGAPARARRRGIGGESPGGAGKATRGPEALGQAARGPGHRCPVPSPLVLQLMSLTPRMHLLFPLTLVRSFWSDVMDSAQSLISSSWTFYLQADDGKIVIFQSKPEVQFAPSFDEETSDLRDSSADKAAGKSGLFVRSRSQTRRGSWEDGENGGSFFKCLSINSGWILTTTLVLSVLVLLWICCATVATAVEQYVPTEKLSIYGDWEAANSPKLSRYPASALLVVRCQAEEPGEAGPLPAKVDLARSEI